MEFAETGDEGDRLRTIAQHYLPRLLKHLGDDAPYQEIEEALFKLAKAAFWESFDFDWRAWMSMEMAPPDDREILAVGIDLHRWGYHQPGQLQTAIIRRNLVNPDVEGEWTLSYPGVTTAFRPYGWMRIPKMNQRQIHEKELLLGAKENPSE